MMGRAIAMMMIDEDAALERKLNDPAMTLSGNPLRRDFEELRINDLRRKNLDRLHDDAVAWNDQRHGAAYRAIRSMTYGGGE